MAIIEVAEGLVATIISESQIALNIGSQSGIQEGDLVLLSRSIDVIDPSSKEMLGTVAVPKLRLTVNMLAEKYCLAKVTDRSTAIARSSSFARPLKVITEDPYTEVNDPFKVFVQVGEPARVRRDDDEPPF